MMKPPEVVRSRPPREGRPSANATKVESSTAGWSVRCPFCWRLVLPTNASLHFAVAPRLSYHLWDEHPAQAAILRLHLFRPPDHWPELVEGDEAVAEAYRRTAA